MSYQISEYNGDDEYSIECTGDAVVGDEVRFERATFSGSFRNARFAGFEKITATIIRDSYGKNKQQHTFTLAAGDEEIKIKGRNLYANGVWRKPWEDESQRDAALDEKHARGSIARADRQARLEETAPWRL
jgi:hypothetical protein